MSSPLSLNPVSFTSTSGISANNQFPGSLPENCREIYELISSSWAVQYINSEFLKDSIPIVQSLYDEAGELDKLTRPLNAVWYLCWVIQEAEMTDNDFKYCRSLTACRNLTALMLYKALQDLNPNSTQALLDDFESKVPVNEFWWKDELLSLYTIPKALYLNPATSQPIVGYSQEHFEYVGKLDDYSRILFMCSLLSDQQNKYISLSLEQIQNAGVVILEKVSLNYMDTYSKGLQRLYDFLIKTCKEGGSTQEKAL